MSFLNNRHPRRMTEVIAIVIVLFILVVLFFALRGCL